MPQEVAARAFRPFFTTKPLGECPAWACRWCMASCGSPVVGCASSHSRHVAPRFQAIFPAHAGADIVLPEKPATARQVTGQGETVLIVDDEAPLRKLITGGA